jgi:hypothetical protein
VSADTTNWGDSLGSLPLFHNEESGWKETKITRKRGRYIKLVSESVSSPYWSEFNVFVENPEPAEGSSEDSDREEDYNNGGSASGCFIFSVFR